MLRNGPWVIQERGTGPAMTFVSLQTTAVMIKASFLDDLSPSMAAHKYAVWRALRVISHDSIRIAAIYQCTAVVARRSCSGSVASQSRYAYPTKGVVCQDC